MSTRTPWPRLSDTLPGPRDLGHCQACGAAGNAFAFDEDFSRAYAAGDAEALVGLARRKPEAAERGRLTVWREMEEDDKPRPADRVVVLCGPCGRRLIDPHPRLYDYLAPLEPFPGAMATCRGCRYSEATRCTHPTLKVNGGPGLPLNFPKPTVAMVDGVRGGRRCGWQQVIYSGPVTCRGREEQVK